jgi:hypothetical protein
MAKRSTKKPTAKPTSAPGSERAGEHRTVEELLAAVLALPAELRRQFDSEYSVHSELMQVTASMLLAYKEELQRRPPKKSKPPAAASRIYDLRGPRGKTKMKWPTVLRTIAREGYKTKRGEPYDLDAARALWYQEEVRRQHAPRIHTLSV